MDLHFYVRDGEEQYEIGRAICPMVPRIGETYYLRMSLKGGWKLNPAKATYLDTAYLTIVDVAYDGYNTLEVENDMGAAPYAMGSATSGVQLYVVAKNEDTQAYIDRVIDKERTNQKQ